MADGATLKIERAAKHVADLNALFRKNSPFSYILERNANTGECATFAKKNEPVIDEAGLICGDVVHNLRSALDHAYWGIVSPFATIDRERRRIQFPFCESQTRLEETIKNTLGDRAGANFEAILKRLRPHGEAGGNELLYLIHELNIIDKHRLLIPTGDYTRLTGDLVRRQIPDFPIALSGTITFGQNRRDVAWRGRPMNRHERRVAHVPASGILEQKIDIPVEIVFVIPSRGNHRPVIPTLNALIDVARETVINLRIA
jgi:hypothetical protein